MRRSFWFYLFNFFYGLALFAAVTIFAVGIANTAGIPCNWWLFSLAPFAAAGWCVFLAYDDDSTGFQ
jgi:hypothetical protein